MRSLPAGTIQLETGTTLTHSAFARATGLRKDAIAAMLAVGMLPDTTMVTAQAVAGTALSTRVAETPDPIAVVRLGERESVGDRSIGWCDGLKRKEVADAVLGWWARPPHDLADMKVLHVSFRGVVVAAMRLSDKKPKVDDEGLHFFRGEPLAWLKDTVSGTVKHRVERSDLSTLEKQAVDRIGRQMVTSGGGPIVIEHPKPFSA